MDTELRFGKYQGFTIEDVISTDARYIDWMMRTFEKDEFDNEVIHAVDRKLL